MLQLVVSTEALLIWINAPAPSERVLNAAFKRNDPCAMIRQLTLCLAFILTLLFAFVSPPHGALRGVALQAAQADVAPVIITLPNKPPKRSSERNPTAQALIETWLDGYGWPKNKRFDEERYEIVKHRVVWAQFGRALLQFRVLSLDGDAMAFAAKRCPGRNRPIEMQIYFQWSPENNLWTALANRGDPGFEACSEDELWTSEQVEKIVNPPPLPVPPKIAQKDVVTPPAGSPERKAIMDGLRPIFEKAFGKPIEFQVNTLRVAAGFAWVVVHPQRPNGSPISKSQWEAVVGTCEQNRTTASSQFWMRKRDGAWQVGWSNAFCPSDSIVEQGYLIGAPPQLIDRDEWPSVDYMPVGEPQYFDLWWP